MLFFVEGEVRKIVEYLGEDTIFPHKTVIQAENHGEACAKYEQYWRTKEEAWTEFKLLNYDITEGIM